MFLDSQKWKFSSFFYSKTNKFYSMEQKSEICFTRNDYDWCWNHQFFNVYSQKLLCAIHYIKRVLYLFKFLLVYIQLISFIENGIEIKKFKSISRTFKFVGFMNIIIQIFDCFLWLCYSIIQYALFTNVLILSIPFLKTCNIIVISFKLRNDFSISIAFCGQSELWVMKIMITLNFYSRTFHSIEILTTCWFLHCNIYADE